MSVVVLTGVLSGGAASAALAEPSAEVSPAHAEPGGSVTVSVTCDPVGGSPPATLEAASQAFEDGLAELSLAGGQDGETSGAAYQGTARIVLPEDIDTGGAHTGGADTGGSGTGAADTGGSGIGGAGTGAADTGGSGIGGAGTGETDTGGSGIGGAGTGETDTGGSGTGGADTGGSGIGGAGTGGAGSGGAGTGGEDSAWTVDGTCPAAHGEEGKPWSATFTVARGGGPGQGHRGGRSASPCPDPEDAACGTAVVQRGVRAGEGGGAFGVSVPALVLGGLLIAGALGAAAHRLYLRGSGADG
ncbi:hypothetical protein [Streptomyces glaucescens]|uniref:hypothetical protein n=1 Tax=Streptomyces glaucescens TaxID=1907 RepID=UPI000694ECF7|nr:hypothetical protein [Streptomyces glaucescens]